MVRRGPESPLAPTPALSRINNPPLPPPLPLPPRLNPPLHKLSLHLPRLLPARIQPLHPHPHALDVHAQRDLRVIDQTPRSPQPFLQALHLRRHLLELEHRGRDVAPRLLAAVAHVAQQGELVVVLGQLGAVAAEPGPEVAENLVAAGVDLGVAARGDGGDGVEPVLEGLEEGEEGLGFEEEGVDLGLDHGGVLDVEVEEAGGGELDGLEGVQEVLEEEADDWVGPRGGGGVLRGQVVEGALRPAPVGQDHVAGPADVGVELGQGLDRAPGEVDEAVDLEEEFFFGGDRDGGVLHDGAEVAHGEFARFEG